jgi:hypothetical protein
MRLLALEQPQLGNSVLAVGSRETTHRHVGPCPKRIEGYSARPIGKI